MTEPTEIEWPGGYVIRTTPDGPVVEFPGPFAAFFETFETITETGITVACPHRRQHFRFPATPDVFRDGPR